MVDIAVRPAEAAADLFAPKGRARPVGEGPVPADTAPPAPAPPATDLFGEPVDPAAFDRAARGEDADADESAPAASLFSILSRPSAAVALPGGWSAGPLADTAPTPETGEEQGTSGESSPTVEAFGVRSREPSSDLPIRLPVPVGRNLPALVPAPSHGKRRNAVLVAAAAAAAIVGAVGITFLFATNDPPLSDPMVAQAAPNKARTETPAATVGTDAEPSASQRPAVIETVEPVLGGATVIAGRAEPDVTLIVLHNGQPLGTARTDSSGAWRIQADIPVRVDRHEISVTRMQVETSLTLPPSSLVPQPDRRPAVPPVHRSANVPSNAAAPYIVQLASLPSAADARLETTRIAARLAGVIAPASLSIRDARIEDGRTVWRVAVGGFASKEHADTLCARVQAQKESCLVLKSP